MVLQVPWKLLLLFVGQSTDALHDLDYLVSITARNAIQQFCNMLSLWQQHRQALGLPNEVMPAVEAEEDAVPGVSPRISAE